MTSHVSSSRISSLTSSPSRTRSPGRSAAVAPAPPNVPPPRPPGVVTKIATSHAVAGDDYDYIYNVKKPVIAIPRNNATPNKQESFEVEIHSAGGTVLGESRFSRLSRSPQFSRTSEHSSSPSVSSIARKMTSSMSLSSCPSPIPTRTKSLNDSSISLGNQSMNDSYLTAMNESVVYSVPFSSRRGTRSSDSSAGSGYTSASLDSTTADINVSFMSSKSSPASPAPKAKRERFQLCDFEVGRTLGTGSFGRVKFAKFTSGSPLDVRLAIKILKKECVKRLNQVEHIKHEKNILEAISFGDDEVCHTDRSQQEQWSPISARHPFIVRLFGTFQDSTNLYMVLEFVRGGEFFCHLRQRGHFQNKDAMFYTASVGSVFAYLHSLDVVYRDLKPENLLLDHEGFLKVVDFGFAKYIPDDKTFTLCGTPEYIAPEVLLNKGHGKGVDWWALGILTYEMLSGVAPFSDDDPMIIYQKIVKCQVQYPSYFDPDSRSLLRRLLQVDLSKRYGCLASGARDVLTHRWFAGFDFRGLMTRSMTPPVVPTTKNQDDTSCFEFYSEADETSPKQTATKKPWTAEDDAFMRREFSQFDVVCF